MGDSMPVMEWLILSASPRETSFPGSPHATPQSPQRPRNTTAQKQPTSLSSVASFAPLRETFPFPLRVPCGSHFPYSNRIDPAWKPG
jgi:hypothetical protein